MGYASLFGVICFHRMIAAAEKKDILNFSAPPGRTCVEVQRGMVEKGRLR